MGEEVIYKSAIPATDVQALMQYCSGRNIPCIAVGEYDICVCQPNDQVRQIFHDFLKVDVLPVKTPEEAIQGREIFQMTPFITAEEEKEILPSIPNCEIGRWFPAFADITAKGNNKQKGIDEIIRHFNIRLEETVAFGDGGNDISMLRHAGIGVAMGNASDDVKAVADYITTTVDDDGIANALKQLIGES